jgi:hypothetical protein
MMNGMMGTILWPVLGGTLLLIALVVAGGVLLLRTLYNRTKGSFCWIRGRRPVGAATDIQGIN